jgi:hypothetical protein
MKSSVAGPGRFLSGFCAVSVSDESPTFALASLICKHATDPRDVLVLVTRRFPDRQENASYLPFSPPPRPALLGQDDAPASPSHADDMLLRWGELESAKLTDSTTGAQIQSMCVGLVDGEIRLTEVSDDMPISSPAISFFLLRMERPLIPTYRLMPAAIVFIVLGRFGNP